MDTETGARDVSGWVAFDGRRPPLLLTAVFATAASMYLAGALTAAATAPDDVAVPDEVRFAVALAALAAAVGLWPFLPWRAAAPARAKAATAAFLGVSLVLLALGGGVPTFFLTAVAVGNAMAVFGAGGAFGYIGLSGALALGLHLGDPGQSLVGALFETAAVIALCLVMVLVFAALTESRRKAERTAEVLTELQDAHGELRRSADRLRELAVSEERARMAREMHDSIGHYLTVINMNLANARRFRAVRPDDAWREVGQAQELTREALADTRRWVRALRPLRMEGGAGAGTAAMAALAESFAGTDLAVEFAVEDAPATAPPRSVDTGPAPGAPAVAGTAGAVPSAALGEDAELICYRALQEGLTNAVRHSGADRVRAVLRRSGPDVELTVRDNGRGTGPGAVGEGFGLHGLRERAAGVGGELAAGNRPEGGFELRLRVPARPAAAPAVPGSAVRAQA